MTPGPRQEPAELAVLRAVYGAYLEDYDQRVAESGPFRGLQKFLLGAPPAADRRADAAFYQSVERAVAELEAALGPEDGETAVRAARLMLLEADGGDAASRLMMEAAQALAIPLLAHVPPAEAAGLLEGYLARYPKKRMLAPRQRELLAELEKRAGQDRS